MSKIAGDINHHMMRNAKTHHCDGCKHSRFIDIEGMLKPRMDCLMLHKPRFYAPDYFDLDTWSYKRKCEDFAVKDKT